MPTPLPGWYADPAGSDRYRWWDGETWTDALSSSAHARPPVGAAPAGPETDAEVETEHPSPPKAPSRGGVETLEVGPQSRLARPVAAVVVLALIAVAALGVGAVLFRPDRTASSSAGSPTPATQPSDPASGSTGWGSTAPGSSAPSPSVPPGWFDQRTGVAKIGDASMTLPSDPYELSSDTGPLASVVDAMFSTNAPVHLSYRGTNSWYSTVALVHVPADQGARDPEQVSQEATSALLGWLFYGVDAKLATPQYVERQVSGRAAVEVRFEAQYDVEDLPSTHDDVTVLIVGLADGSYAGAVSSVPNDAPQSQRTMARAALDSLSVG